jgi:hypothetical protein
LPVQAHGIRLPPVQEVGRGMTGKPPVHHASKDPETGMVQFTFGVDQWVISGQVPSEDEYRNYLAAFQAWRKVTLPAPADVPWAEQGREG